jgi:Ca-activated chloride channel family protein
MKRSTSLAVLAAVCLCASPFIAAAQEGPKRESGETVVKPRKKDGTAPEPEQPKIPSKFPRKGEGTPKEGSPTFRSDVNTVQVDVAVLDNKGRFIPNIPRGNFRVVEEGVPQQITNYSMGEAPMTVAMVIEFSNLFQRYWSETWYQTLTASYGFLETLKPEDFVAVVAYDMRPEILSDFSTNKQQAYEAMQRLRIAAFSESNLFDALTDTADRMSEIEGRKAIVLISSGLDTFSKLTFDKTRKSLQTSGVPI